MLDKKLMSYIPKEYKSLVVDIHEGEKDFDEETNRWFTPLVVEWENGETSCFQNKSFARGCLKEFHTPDEYSL